MGASRKINITIIRPDSNEEKIDSLTLRELRIVKKINSHIRVFLTGGQIKLEEKSLYLRNTDLQTRIIIDYQEDGGRRETIFVGVVTRIELEYEPGGDFYYMKLWGASYTCLLDMMPHTRSFQDPEMSYKDLFGAVEAGYMNALILPGIGLDDQKLQQFTMQYLETDWKFLKRLASRFQTGLTPDPIASKPALCVGLPTYSKEIELSMDDVKSIKKRISYFQDVNDQHPKDSEPELQVYYKVRLKNFLNIGQTAKLPDCALLYVYQSTAFMEKSEIYFEALLTPENGMRQRPLYNKRLVGTALEGSVVETGGDTNDAPKDKVQLHLNCDVLRPVDKYCWFPMATFYSAEGNTGLYCLPEKNDFVYLYFPSCREEEAVVMNSLRETELDSPRLKKLTTKYWRTAAEKQLALSPAEVSLSGKGNDLYITLSQTEGVVISSPDQLTIHADGDLTMSTNKNINITAAKTIRLQSGKSSITLNEEASQKGKAVSGLTHIVGTKVKKLEPEGQKQDRKEEEKKWYDPLLDGIFTTARPFIKNGKI